MNRSTLLQGVGLSALFFYPLTVSLINQSFYLHWRRLDSVLFALGFALLALGFTAILAALDRLARPRLTASLQLALMVVPLLSFSLHFARELRLVDEIGRAAFLARRQPLFAGVVATVLSFALASLVWRKAMACRTVCRTTSQVSAALALMLAWALATVHPISDSGDAQRSPPRAAASEDALLLADAVVLLFDEMSYAALYDGAATISDEFPRLRDFATTATSYHQASSPGWLTSVSMPGFVLGSRGLGLLTVERNRAVAHYRDGRVIPLDLDSNNIFRQARDAGFETSLFGWYFPYCSLLAASLDHCQSFSGYNWSTVATWQSPLDPILTTATLWPHESPLGILKSRVTTRVQRRTVAKTEAALVASFAARQRQFVFAHFSIPHWPFAFDGADFHPPGDPYSLRDDDYRAQLRHVDIVVGRVLDALAAAGKTATTTVVITSDHERRGRNDPDHVPLLIRRAGTNHRGDVDDPVEAEEVIAAIAAGR